MRKHTANTFCIIFKCALLILAAALSGLISPAYAGDSLKAQFGPPCGSNQYIGGSDQASLVASARVINSSVTAGYNLGNGVVLSCSSGTSSIYWGPSGCTGDDVVSSSGSCVPPPNPCAATAGQSSIFIWAAGTQTRANDPSGWSYTDGSLAAGNPACYQKCQVVVASSASSSDASCYTTSQTVGSTVYCAVPGTNNGTQCATSDLPASGTPSSASLPVACPDGSHLSAGSTCPVIKCSDGSTAPNGGTCYPVSCPDGTTVPNGQTCSPVSCSDGTSVPNGQTCPTGTGSGTGTGTGSGTGTGTGSGSGTGTDPGTGSGSGTGTGTGTGTGSGSGTGSTGTGSQNGSGNSTGTGTTGTLVTPDLTNRSFYTKKYPNGLTGVLEHGTSLLRGTPIGGLIPNLFPTIGPSGGCPSYSLPEGRVMGITVGGPINLPCSMWTFISVCINITALFVARRLIFGG